MVWDLATGTARHDLKDHYEIWAMAVSGDGTRAVTGGEDKNAMVWDLDTGTPTAVWRGDAAMKAIAWAPGKPVFVVGDHHGAVHILGLRVHGASAGQALRSAQQIGLSHIAHRSGWHQPRSGTRRICKVSLDSTLSGRPEEHCEAHVSSPALRSLRSDRTTGQGVGVQIYLSCRVSAFRPTCRVA